MSAPQCQSHTAQCAGSWGYWAAQSSSSSATFSRKNSSPTDILRAHLEHPTKVKFFSDAAGTWDGGSFCFFTATHLVMEWNCIVKELGTDLNFLHQNNEFHFPQHSGKMLVKCKLVSLALLLIYGAQHIQCQSYPPTPMLFM